MIANIAHAETLIFKGITQRRSAQALSEAPVSFASKAPLTVSSCLVEDSDSESRTKEWGTVAL